MAEVRVIVRKKTRSPFPWKRFWRKLALTMGLVLAAWWVFLQLWSMAFPRLFRFYEVETGTLFRQLPVDRALVVRDETVVFAARAGTFQPAAPEGQRVTEKDTVAILQAAGGTRQVVAAPRAGVVCYHTDGWEKVLTPQSLETLDLVHWDQVPPALAEAGPGTLVEAGRPLFKIVNNLQPPLIWFKFDSEYLGWFPAVGKKVSFRLGEAIYEGTLRGLTSQGITAWGWLEVDRKEMLHEREVEISLILARADGPIIPNEALVWRDEAPGVYKKNMQGYQWVPVEVLLQEEDYSVVKGLSRGDLVITNPYLIEEASRLPAISKK